MSKHRVVVLKIVAGQLTVTEAAEEYGISRRHLHRLLARYRDGGLEAVDPQSRRPQSNPRSTPPNVVERILQLRAELLARGLDAGRMHHLGIGRHHTGKRILAITDETTVTVIHLDTGEILSEHSLDPTRGYWRNQLQPPGRSPQKRQMSRDI